MRACETCDPTRPFPPTRRMKHHQAVESIFYRNSRAVDDLGGHGAARPELISVAVDLHKQSRRSVQRCCVDSVPRLPWECLSRYVGKPDRMAVRRQPRKRAYVQKFDIIFLSTCVIQREVARSTLSVPAPGWLHGVRGAACCGCRSRTAGGLLCQQWSIPLPPRLTD